MSHPMKSKCSDHRDVGRARYKAQGGPVDLGGPSWGTMDAAEWNADAAKEDLGNAMHRESTKHQFHDGGTRVPGKNAAKNYQWEKSKGFKSNIVKD